MSHQGEDGLSPVVTLVERQQPDITLLALNYYCWAFPLNEGRLGIWCNEPRYVRVMAFDVDSLAAFPLADIVGWFNRSQDRVYARSAPTSEIELPWTLTPGTHHIDIPEAFSAIDELLVISSHPAATKQEPAIAILSLRPAASTVEVLPQTWYTAADYRPGYQWVTRVVRDPASGHILGEGIGIKPFELDESGTQIARWLE
ncbi:MAG: hypothetical protein JO187_07425 [Acidobacteria bacterium]|nr:hypothetical protein [Acidobacteriota bacterium]